jgi:hypothetical protein
VLQLPLRDTPIASRPTTHVQVGNTGRLRFLSNWDETLESDRPKGFRGSQQHNVECSIFTTLGLGVGVTMPERAVSAGRIPCGRQTQPAPLSPRVRLLSN